MDLDRALLGGEIESSTKDCGRQTQTLLGIDKRLRAANSDTTGDRQKTAGGKLRHYWGSTKDCGRQTQTVLGSLIILSKELQAENPEPTGSLKIAPETTYYLLLGVSKSPLTLVQALSLSLSLRSRLSRLSALGAGSLAAPSRKSRVSLSARCTHASLRSCGRTVGVDLALICANWVSHGSGERPLDTFEVKCSDHIRLQYSGPI